MTLTLAIITLLFAATAHAARPLPERIARTITATWTCQDAIGEKRTKAGNVWAPHSTGYRQWQLSVWKARREACRQQNWQAWLPAHWQRVGQCETQLNWRHYNSSYEGAFGFATSSWDAFKPAGYPDHANQATPWQQFVVALRIHARYGFSGWGCRNA